MSSIMEPKTKQVQFRLTAADRALLERQAAKLKISMSDVMSKALNGLDGAPGALVIHDYFDGTDHCVECKGHCRLRTDDAAVSEVVRGIFENSVWQRWGQLPEGFEAPLKSLLGAKRCQNFWHRAKIAVAKLKRSL